MGLGVEEEEHLGLFDRRLPGRRTVFDHVPPGKTLPPVGIEHQELAGEMTAGPAQLAQGHLELLGLGHGMRLEQVVEAAIAGEKGQAVGQFEAVVAQGAVGAQGGTAQGGLMHALEGHPGRQFQERGVLAPLAEQLPGAQAQMLGQEQPDSEQAAADFIGEALADLAFEAERLEAFESPPLAAVVAGDADRRLPRVQGVEFFFAGRSRRRCARRCVDRWRSGFGAVFGR